MKDKDGFNIRCKYADWQIINENDDKDYVCTMHGCRMVGLRLCYCDDKCRDYKPIKEVNV